MRPQIIDTNSNLLRQVAEGSPAAFAQLFHIHRDKLYSFILCLCGSPQQAEDIVQDVFLKIWLMRSDLGEIREFDHYLYRTAHNHCINILKRKMHETAILSEIKSAHQTSLPEEHLCFKEAEAFIHNAIEELPYRQKQVFILSREQGLDQQQISKKLHISVPTVKSHMTQALRWLRSRCKEHYPVIKSIVVLIGCFN